MARLLPIELRRRRRRGPSALGWVGLWLALGTACSRDVGVKLPLEAPLPEAFPSARGSRLEIELGAERSRRSPHFLDYREALLAALGVVVPRPGAEAASASGPSAFRKSRNEDRLERTA